MKLVIRLAPVLVVVAGLGAVAGPAAANFPGRNGPLYYASPNPTPDPTVEVREGTVCLAPPVCIPAAPLPPRVETSQGTDIVMQKADDLRPTAFTNTPGVDETGARVSADGRRIVFLRSFPGPLGGYDEDTTGFYTAERGDKNERLVLIQTEAPYRYHAMAWSPDDRLVAIRCRIKTWNPCEIVTLNSDGTQVTSINAPVGPKGLMDLDLSVTPDGTEVVYSTDAPDNTWQVIVAKLDGSGSRNLGEGGSADISPDGSTIAFTSDTGEPGCDFREEIWTMSAADGSNRQNISRLPCENTGIPAQHRDESAPEWSPDGKWIAHAYDNSNIGLISADGSTRKELFRAQSWELRPTVSWGQPPGGGRPPR